MPIYGENAQRYGPINSLLTREECEEMLRGMMNSDYQWHIESEEMIERYLHIAYDEDFNINEEMMREFECQEAVDYLLTLMNGNGVRDFLTTRMEFPTWHPIAVLLLYYHGIPRSDKPGVLNTLLDIYMRNQMEDYAFMTWLAVKDSEVRRPGDEV